MTGPDFDERAARERVARWAPERVRAVSLAIVDNSAPLFDIEAAASCNLSCRFCPRDALTRPQRIMTPETFAAVERFLPAGAVVMFAGLGEPLTNHHLPDYVARLKRRGVSPCVITNGMLIHQAADRGADRRRHRPVPGQRPRDRPGGLPHARARYRRRPPRRQPPRTSGGTAAAGAAGAPQLRCRRQKQRRASGRRTALARELGFDLFVRAEHNRGGHLGGGPMFGPAGAGSSRPSR
jgi:hypothetical protein